MSQKLKTATAPTVSRDKRIKKPIRTILFRTAAALTGLLTGLSSVLGFPSFMCAAAAELAGENAVWVFLGAVGAYFIRGSVIDGIVQLCAVLTIAAIHALDPFGERRDEPLYGSMLTTGSLMLFSCVLTAAMPADFYTAAMRMINSLLSGAIVFIARSLLITRQRSGMFDLSGISGVFVGIFYIMAVSALASARVLVFDLARIVGTFLILTASGRYRSTGGAVIGALTACGVLLCEPSIARNTMLLAAAGLISGAFGQLGMLISVMSFLISLLIGLVAVGVNADTYHMFADAAAGAVLFAGIPASAVKRAAACISGLTGSVDIVGQTTSSRLMLAGKSLADIRERLDLAGETILRRTAARSLSQEVRRCVCSQCDCHDLCFIHSQSAPQGFLRLEELAASGEIDASLVSQEVPCCTRPQLIADAFGEFSRRFAQQRGESLRVRELRELLCADLSVMEDILADLSFRASSVRSIDPLLSSKLRDKFSLMGFRSVKACVYVDDTVCRRADVYIVSPFKGDLVKLTASVGALLDCDMGLPDIIDQQGITRLSFAQVPPMHALTAVYTASAGGEYSGDSYEIFDLNGSEKYVLLSDGMGTGKRARLDSVFALTLARKLISSGLSMTTAHKLINSMLRVKGWEESFATLDMLRVDLNGGCAGFLKAGAVSSRLCRDGGFTVIGSQAFPAGILAHCDPDVGDLKLFEGDTILMTSDGADEDTADLLAATAAAAPHTDLETLVRQLGALALEHRDKTHTDDLTVILVRVQKGGGSR